jgi:hypothetical protein
VFWSKVFQYRNIYQDGCCLEHHALLFTCTTKSLAETSRNVCIEQVRSGVSPGFCSGLILVQGTGCPDLDFS